MQVFLFTTPIIIALQYFSVNGDIFSFRRNAQTFIICIVVLFTILRLFVAVVAPPDYILKLLPDRIGRRGRRQVHRRNSEGCF
jgi:hypothetical protein